MRIRKNKIQKSATFKSLVGCRGEGRDPAYVIPTGYHKLGLRIEM